jgi:hypothetical protein
VRHRARGLRVTLAWEPATTRGSSRVADRLPTLAAPVLKSTGGVPVRTSSRQLPLLFLRISISKNLKPTNFVKGGLGLVESEASAQPPSEPFVHAAGTKPPTQWRARRRPLGPAPSVRSAGDFRVCGWCTIPGASRSRAAQERARRPIASHTRSVLNLGRVYCPFPVHRRRVPHRAPSRPVHDSGR